MQRVTTFRLMTSLLIGAISIVVSSPARAAAPDDVTQLTAALDELDRWVGQEANGERWNKYLGSRALRAQIAKGQEADPAVVSRVLGQYRSGAKGLNKKRFQDVRREIESWRAVLKQQYIDDLPKLAWASRGDYQSVSKAKRLEASRVQLRRAAQALERKLGRNHQFVKNWKRYLRWDRLEPHLTGDVSISDSALEDLTAVLKRFRSNAKGLESPAFTKTASALDSHRGLLQWYHLVEEYARRSRKKYSDQDIERRVYMSKLLELEKQLTRHLETPTIETSRKVGQLQGLVQQLDQSPRLVQAIRANYTQPNIFAEVSESAINRMAQRPIQETQPVRDVILGVRIRGTSQTEGLLTLRTLPAQDHVALELQLEGTIRSSTIGHKKPVRIVSRSSTDFVATKLLHISDDQFVALPTAAIAQTNTRVRSVKKTGGRIGRKFIERVAWKKVGKSKKQGERIASRRAKQKVAKKFDSQVSTAIYQARNNYDQKARPPLVRVGMFPEHLQMASTDHSVTVEATLASYEQLSTDTAPTSTAVGHDLSVSVHETVINNLLPTFLAGVGLKQEEESQPPELLGDYPPWLRELAQKHNSKLASEPAEEQAASEFKPFSATLNSTHPLSVSFDDQQVTLRIRIAELKTIEEREEKIRENWDILLTFQIVQEGNDIILRRTGEIEAFPTGFDPNPSWGDKLTGEQAATRGVLAKVLKKRASNEDGLPKEITLPPFQFNIPEDVEHKPVLQHLDCDNGWLTVGYQLSE